MTHLLVALMPWCLGALLAALPADGSIVRDVFEILGWIFGLAMLAWRVFGARRESTTVGPQPFRVAAAEEFVPRREFEEHKADMRRAHAELKQAMEGRFDKLDREREASIKGLHSHISNLSDTLRGDITAMDERIEERLKTGNATMVAHSEAIAALNERTRSARKAS